MRLRTDNIVVDRKINNVIDGSLLTFNAALYGGMRLDSAPVADTIGPGWKPVDVYDTEVTTPRGLIFSPSAGSFAVLDPGVFNLTWYFSFTHAESPQARTIYWRIWSITNSAPASSEYPIGISRNQPETNRTIPFMIEATPVGPLGNELRFEIGNGADLGAVAWEGASLSINSVSEWRGGFPSA